MQLKITNLTSQIEVVDERVETTEMKLIVMVNGTENQIETLSTNVTNEFGLLESKTNTNINSLSSNVSGLSAKLESLSSTVTANKISNTTIDERIDLKLLRFSTSKSIHLWSMGGAFPNKKV